MDISLQPEELEANKCIFEFNKNIKAIEKIVLLTLPTFLIFFGRYEEAREEERNYAISQRTSVTWSPR